MGHKRGHVRTIHPIRHSGTAKPVGQFYSRKIGATVLVFPKFGESASDAMQRVQKRHSQ